MFLKSRFEEVIWRRPNLEGISYKVLEEEERLCLEKEFSMEEFKASM